jgi:hypothetical protein
MHPTTLEYLVKAGQDDTRRARERDRLLQDARRARHASARQPRHPAPGLPPAGRKRRNTAMRMLRRDSCGSGLGAAHAGRYPFHRTAGAGPGQAGCRPGRGGAGLGGQPQAGTSRFTDQRALGQVKRQASWKAVHHAASR